VLGHPTVFHTSTALESTASALTLFMNPPFGIDADIDLRVLATGDDGAGPMVNSQRARHDLVCDVLDAVGDPAGLQRDDPDFDPHRRAMRRQQQVRQRADLRSHQPWGQICIDVNGDIDGDGIPNGKDFCEHMAGGAYDEDGDGIGDECDPCPIAPPPAQPDPDGDAVDSPCDPDPRTPGARILLFNGFNVPVANAGADWKFQNGDAIVTPSGPDVVEELPFPIAPVSNHVTIFTAYRIDGASTTATTADAAVKIRTMLPFDKTVVQCGGSRASGADAVLLAQTDTEMVTTQNSKTIGTAFSPTATYKVAQQTDGAVANCALVGDTMANSGAIQLPINGSTPSQAVLDARGATVRFSYILVVEQP
jgi:hypothetical protein